jgi:hypothetical protein
MPQLVFVHGVANRQHAGFDAELAAQDELFRQGAFGGDVTIRNPFWGDLGASFAWDQASLPRFGDAAVSFALLGGGGQADGEGPSLAALAEQDFGAAVDTLYVVLLEEEEGAEPESDMVEEFMRAAQYAEDNPNPDWVSADMSDDEFIDTLREQAAAERPASYGLVDKLKEAAGAVVDRGRNLVSTGLLAVMRDDINPLVANFVGDVFVYLKDGPRRNEIRQRIAADLIAAYQAASAGDGALVVIGHSMGGVILLDMLTDPAGAGLPPDFEIDVLMTVGSQPGFFEELKLFAASDEARRKGAQVSLASKPAAARHWWNVYDPVDVLAFRCKGIFEGVEDFTFNSVTGVISAHTTYFKRPRFHARLKARLAEV